MRGALFDGHAGETEPQHAMEELLERRGSVVLGTLRDDDFESQLNWLRE
jgi:hypothetical protein